ncbi:immunoglobulin-like domain-containing protein [Nocardioides gilvus]|uniref:immunoglobulin-like domain-containing protein n=1 Tax=Nocardioides gilvus TaxID=1735589 RepID=UPI0013A57A67|nr:immunoglobulin-like domain-containing protein [Nocardioides gilvus]
MTARTTTRRLGAMGLATATAVASLALVSSTSAARAGVPTSHVLSASAQNPTGGQVRTTFRAAAVQVAGNGFQGSVASLPTTLVFAHDDPQELADDLLPNDDDLVRTPSTRGIAFQRFDVPVQGAGQRLSWTGRLDPTRLVQLRAWTGSEWEVLAQARGLQRGLVSLDAAVDPRHRHGAVVPVMITAEDPFADDLDHEVKDSFEDPDSYDFSLAHLSDTQFLTRGALAAETAKERAVWKRAYTASTQWIADNAKQRKIAFAAHTGDLVENWLNDEDTVAAANKEFAVASRAQAILEDAGVVNTALAGNHDNLSGRDVGPASLYNDWFGPERYAAVSQHPNWAAQGASYESWRPDDNSNHTVLFSAGGLDFVAVSLGFRVTEEEAAWADSVLKRHPDRNAIVLTHANGSPSISPDGRGNAVGPDGRLIRAEVVDKNPNVFLVLSGHEHGVSIDVRKDAGREDNHVVELLADYQGYRVDSDLVGLTGTAAYPKNTGLRLGASFLRLLQFDVARSEMSVDTYSPLLDEFGTGEYDTRNRYDGTEDDFRVPIQLQTRTTSFATDGLVTMKPSDEVIGTSTAASGRPSTVVWEGLESGRPYAWQALSTDAATGAILSEAPTSVFTASDGDDTTPPVLSVPGNRTIRHGSDFDPMAGVAARDQDGTVLTSRVEVSGSVDTSRPGRTTLVHTVTDRAGNQAVASRDVVVARAPAPVNTRLPRIKGRTKVGAVLTVDVGGWDHATSAETTVQWRRGGKAIPGATGSDYRVRRTDAGGRVRARVEVRVNGRREVSVLSNVLPIAKMNPRVKLKAPARIRPRARATVTATFRGVHAVPTGQARLKIGARTLGTVTLRRGVAKFRLPRLARGRHTLRVTLPASNRWNEKKGTLRIRVRR